MVKKNMHLQARTRLDTAQINEKQYTLSIMSESVRLGVLEQEEAEQIQSQIMQALSEAVQRYTSKESSSVRTEVAQTLLQSVTYSIDVYLLSLHSRERSLFALQGEGIAALRAKGLQLVNAHASEAVQLLNQAQESRVETDLLAYNDTIDKALPAFFKDYNAEFSAHETIAGSGIDYPLACDDEELTGVLYIRRYLERLCMENTFCAGFSLDDIERLLEGCGRQYQTDYRELLINVCDTVLGNAICSVLLGRQATNLAITATECTLLYAKLRRLPAGACSLAVGKAVDAVVAELGAPVHLQEYLHVCGDRFATRLHHAVQQNALTGLVITSA